jgi:hypothetical protein
MLPADVVSRCCQQDVISVPCLGSQHTACAKERFRVLSVTLRSFIWFNVLQLLGVGLVAIQGGLGEASALGLCSLYPNQLSLTAWSSGTGFAGEGWLRRF